MGEIHPRRSGLICEGLDLGLVGLVLRFFSNTKQCISEPHHTLYTLKVTGIISVRCCRFLCPWFGSIGVVGVSVLLVVEFSWLFSYILASILRGVIETDRRMVQVYLITNTIIACLSTVSGSIEKCISRPSEQ